MNLENEDKCSSDKAPETVRESLKQSKILYTREFILSLSGLDICKKLPIGFDEPILSGLGDISHDIQDRPRILGSVPLQGFRRSDYGSSPPTRGDSGSYSRGTYGRWDNHSSGRSDRDSDSQSDRDSDTGRRYGNQSRRSWHSSEHDGLLGSGSFPRPQGDGAGMSAPKVQVNDHNQLNKSNEPYHPPRPYKAVPHPRRYANDSYNDETFGSTECASQDRAEEERKRRVSFELMRKEQQKVLQENQQSNLDKLKEDGVDITSLQEDTKEEKKLLEKNNELDAFMYPPVSSNDSGKTYFPSQTPASRPLVPPGFASTILENPGSKSLIPTHPTEVGKPESGQVLLHAKVNSLQNGILDDQDARFSTHEMGLSEQQTEDKSIHAPFSNRGEKIVNSSSGLEVSDKEHGMVDHLQRDSSTLEAHETADNGEIIELNARKMTGHKSIVDSTQHNSTLILEKILNNALTVNIGDSSGFIEHRDGKQDDTCSSTTVQSSKFAQWFFEDEKKPVDERSSGRPCDLLSLIVGGEKSGPQDSVVKANQHLSPEISYPSYELSNRLMTSNIPPTTTGISEQLYDCINPEAVPTVLTCEDLEQTILSEYSEKSSTLLQSVQDWSLSDATAERPKADIDDRASQDLLSLLQKGTCREDFTPFPTKDIRFSEKLHVSEVVNFGSLVDKPEETNAENIDNLGKTLTLEKLFGTAFMTELQSVEAPLSVQRGSAGSARTDDLHGLSFPVMDDSRFPSTIAEVESIRTNRGSKVLVSNHRQQTKLDQIDTWLGIDDPQIEVDSSKLTSEIVSKHVGLDGTVEIHLPEEENLISVAYPVNPQNSMFMRAGNSSRGEFLSSDSPVHITDKLEALNAVFKDERYMIGQEGRSFARGPRDMDSEIPYRNFHAQPSPQFHSPQLSHGRPLFHPFDSHPAHINSQMKFRPHEGIIHHDAPPNHQFPPNMLRPPLHHPSGGLTGFNLPAHDPMLQQMQMAGNFPPHHLLHEYPRGAPLPLHPRNQGTGFVQEPNLMQGYPFGHRKPNVSGIGMSLPAPDINRGGSHPEALQRLIEMELRANAKQIHPFAVGHSRGMYGDELDMGFQYR